MRLFVSILLAGVLFAQQPEPAKPKRLPEPKNLQVLKVPPSELIAVMRNYNASLGVQCTFCHVQGNFASDDYKHKAIARRMITMTQDLNAKLATATDAKAVVGCFTCHRGEAHPQADPPASAMQQQGGPRPAGAPPAAPQP